VRIIASAGVTRWKKLFTNLRVSRLNELVRDRRFASHVVDAWVGNSEKVRRDHYLLVTDADYQAAVSGAGEIPAQIPAHSPLISSHQESSTLYDSREKRLQSHGDVENQLDAENQYPRQGANKRGLTREKPGRRRPPGAESGTTKRGRRAAGKTGGRKPANGRKGGAR
jgi:hypothetical protein